MLYFKTSAIRMDWMNLNLDKRLRFIVLGIVGFVGNRFGKDVVITSIFRPGDSGVHGHWRGIDLRSRIYNTTEIKTVRDFVNNHIPYSVNGRYVTCLYHNAGKCQNCGAKYNATLEVPTFWTCKECGAEEIVWRGWHFHFQVNRGKVTKLLK